jgi:hypothetical protein
MPETRNVTIKVESLGVTQTNHDGSRSQQVKCFVDELGMRQFPTPIFVPVNAGLQAGNEYQVTLAKGKLKPSKEGNWDSDFYWDWVSMADPDAQPQQQAQLPNATEVYAEQTYEADPWDTPSPPKPKPAWNGQGCPPGRDSINYSIEMQVIHKDTTLSYPVGTVEHRDAFIAGRAYWLRTVWGIEVPAEEPDPSSL